MFDSVFGVELGSSCLLMSSTGVESYSVHYWHTSQWTNTVMLIEASLLARRSEQGPEVGVWIEALLYLALQPDYYWQPTACKSLNLIILPVFRQVLGVCGPNLPNGRQGTARAEKAIRSAFTTSGKQVLCGLRSEGDGVGLDEFGPLRLPPMLWRSPLTWHTHY